MPERRRPGLRKTLVAAARTAVDSVADGVDALADRAEALADGLRSLGRGRRSTPAADPRFAGIDPALAAYVAARDPVWFSFDVRDDTLVPEAWLPTAEQNATSVPFETGAENAGDPAPAAVTPASPRRRSRRDEPSAAELPGGRAVPPRIAFRQPRQEPDAAPSPDRHFPLPDPVRFWRPAAAGPDANTISRAGRTGGDAGATATATASAGANAERVSAASDVAAVPVSLPRSAPDTTSAPGARWAAPTYAKPAASVPATGRTIEVQTRSAPGAPPDFARPDASAPNPWRPLERSSPASPAPARISFAPTRTPDDDAADVPADGRRSATPSPAPPHPSPTPRDTAAPAPWPDLPPSRGSASTADVGGLLVWAGAAGSDVLVDEQRST